MLGEYNKTSTDFRNALDFGSELFRQENDHILFGTHIQTYRLLGYRPQHLYSYKKEPPELFFDFLQA